MVSTDGTPTTRQVDLLVCRAHTNLICDMEYLNNSDSEMDINNTLALKRLECTE